MIIVCGRYVVFSENEYGEMQNVVQEVSDRLGMGNTAKGEVFPAKFAPVIYQEEGKKILAPMKWSFGEYYGRPIINSRAETIIDKPIFRNSFQERRCLVPANAYYEWKKETGIKEKIKFEISINQTELFFMAGIYNSFKDRNGISYTGYSIITTAANQATAYVHHRMPVIIEPGSENLWLSPNPENSGVLIDMLRPYTFRSMELKAVS